MNKKQRIAILIGIILVLICGLFPPYEGEIGGRMPAKKELGYHFILDPPSFEEIYKEISVMKWEEAVKHRPDVWCRAYIKTTTYIVQIVTIVLVTFSLIFFFKSNN